MSNEMANTMPHGCWPAAMRKPLAAAYCGLSVRSFERAVSAGQIAPRRASDRVAIYLRNDLDAFLADLPAEKCEMPNT